MIVGKQAWACFPFYIVAPFAQQASDKANVVIGTDVRLGVQAIILSGVSIGNGAIGAGAVFTKSISAMAVGVPARVVGARRLSGG